MCSIRPIRLSPSVPFESPAGLRATPGPDGRATLALYPARRGNPADRRAGSRRARAAWGSPGPECARRGGVVGGEAAPPRRVSVPTVSLRPAAVRPAAPGLPPVGGRGDGREGYRVRDGRAGGYHGPGRAAVRIRKKDEAGGKHARASVGKERRQVCGRTVQSADSGSHRLVEALPMALSIRLGHDPVERLPDGCAGRVGPLCAVVPVAEDALGVGEHHAAAAGVCRRAGGCGPGALGCNAGPPLWASRRAARLPCGPPAAASSAAGHGDERVAWPVRWVPAPCRPSPGGRGCRGRRPRRPPRRGGRGGRRRAGGGPWPVVRCDARLGLRLKRPGRGVSADRRRRVARRVASAVWPDAASCGGARRCGTGRRGMPPGRGP